MRKALYLDNIISIHAPHARSDVKVLSVISKYKFQSTLLMRGATESKQQSILT